MPLTGNVISMNFYPIRPVINAQLNSTDQLNLTGQIGCKSIEIDAGRMPLTGNVISISTQFDQ